MRHWQSGESMNCIEQEIDATVHPSYIVSMSKIHEELLCLTSTSDSPMSDNGSNK